MVGNLLSSETMREIVTLQVGDFANFIGSHFWNFQVKWRPKLFGLCFHHTECIRVNNFSSKAYIPHEVVPSIVGVSFIGGSFFVLYYDCNLDAFSPSSKPSD